MALEVEVFFDPACPWCYIARRRLGTALCDRAGLPEVAVRWRPFELDPALPPAGADRRAYRAARVGSGERADALDEQVATVARTEGLALDLARIERRPNTLAALRLVARTEEPDGQDRLVDALFRGYLVEGRDLGDHAALLGLAAGAGLDRAWAEGVLGGDQGTAEVRGHMARARRLGLFAVPTGLINGWTRLHLLGDPYGIRDALKRAAGIAPDAPPARRQHGFERTRCGCDFCTAYCRHAPGRLDLADLDRLCPEGQDVFSWAEQHLRAVVGQPYPKLIPAPRPDGSCHWLEDGRCTVHAAAPFGCAFFDAHMPADEVARRSRAATEASQEDAARGGRYTQVWHHLIGRGLTAPGADRDALNAELDRLRASMELH